MQKYLKVLFHIFKNYHFYSIPILFSETLFYLKHKNIVNKFKYLNDDFLSDSIPCPYYFLKKIKKFIVQRNIKYLCDLGSGYGKVLYFFGDLNNYQIDGIELNEEVYLDSTILSNDNIKIFNENILEFNLNNKKYDLFIMNDPLKKNEDLLELILKIKKFCKKSYLIFINLDKKKIESANCNLKLIDSFIVSKNRNILFYSVI
jgi:SAM-dependent methyltransferase